MDNVVTAVFDVESEAYKAFTEIRNKPFGAGYIVAEAALLKRTGDVVTVADSFDAAGVTSDDTTTGMIVGSLVGILGGPFGVLLGASVGALAGHGFDTADAVDSVSMLEVTASKLYDNECAIVALVQEDEPAFDAAFEGYAATIIRHYAADVYEEVEIAREAEEEFVNTVRAQLHAEREADRKKRREDHKAAIKARFEAAKEEHEAKKDEFDAAAEEAWAAYRSATKEIYS